MRGKIIHGKVLFLSLCAMGVTAVLLGVVQMWFDLLPWDMFLKVMASLLILGTEISFLIAVDYDLPASRRKYLLMGTVAMSVVTAGLVLLQIWLHPFAWSVFVKIILTLAAGLGLLGFLLAVAEDFGSNKRLKDQNYID